MLLVRRPRHIRTSRVRVSRGLSDDVFIRTNVVVDFVFCFAYACVIIGALVYLREI